MDYQINDSNGHTVLQCNGRLTISDRAQVDSIVAQMFTSRGGDITVDLGNVDYIDSAGLGILLTLREKGEAQGSSVRLAGVKGDVKEMIEMASFDLLFDVTDAD